ncbi:MAG: NifU family protein [Candidatus Omnitrophota bacterium]|nr:NifU family protein [Candidatus Omnitrophota bacterium]
MREQIEEVLEKEVRPILSIHGGNIELVDVTDDGVIKVKLTGGCVGCASARITLRSIVEQAVKSKVPQVRKVEPV